MDSVHLQEGKKVIQKLYGRWLSLPMKLVILYIDINVQTRFAHLALYHEMVVWDDPCCTAYMCEGIQMLKTDRNSWAG